MFSAQREVRGLSETLAKLDVEKLLIASLADGAICTAELSNPALNPSAPYVLNTSSAATLTASSIILDRIHASGTPGAPLLLQTGAAPSAMSDSLKVASMTFGDFRSTGVANRYTAQLTVSFNGSLIRAVRPIVLQKIITTNPADPANLKRITSCLGGSVGRIWSDVKASRSGLVTYTNSEGYEIEVSVSTYSGNPGTRCSIRISVDGIDVAYNFVNNSLGNAMCSATVTVPPGSSYLVNNAMPSAAPGENTIYHWAELR